MKKHTLFALGLLLLMLASCAPAQPVASSTDNATGEQKQYSDDLARRVEAGRNNKPIQISERPDYLPAAMFERLPPMPADFYQIRQLVRLGRIADLAEINESYWQQPEWFPHFENIGVPLLQQPPKDRWGAYGIAVYPADSVSTVRAGESLDMYFYIKSGYLVETYQGISLDKNYPARAQIGAGAEMPDGTKDVVQDPAVAKRHIKVEADPNPFVLEPNFPLYNEGGTKRVKVIVSVDASTPPGDYVVTLDTGIVPADYEDQWMKEYLNLYTSGGMTTIGRPYYQAFIHIVGGDEE